MTTDSSLSREPVEQPMLAPLAAGGGIVAGISAALIAGYQILDCHAYKSRQGQCDQVITMGIPAVVAGAGAVFSTLGGLWTYNSKLRVPEAPPRRRRGPDGRYR